MIEDGYRRLPFQTAFENDKIQTGLFLLKRTLAKNGCSLKFFRNGLCLQGRSTSKIQQSVEKFGLE